MKFSKKKKKRKNKKKREETHPLPPAQLNVFRCVQNYDNPKQTQTEI